MTSFRLLLNHSMNRLAGAKSLHDILRRHRSNTFDGFAGVGANVGRRNDVAQGEQGAAPWRLLGKGIERGAGDLFLAERGYIVPFG